MSERGRGGGYRAGGRGGARRDNDRRDHTRDRDSDRPRRRSRSRSRDRERGDRDRDRDGVRHRADDRDRVHKPSSRGRPGIGHPDAHNPRKRESTSPAPGAPPRGPKRRKPSPERTWQSKPTAQVPQKMELDEDLSEEEQMARVMGFKKFNTTKEKKIPGNEFNYAVRKEKQTKYRQYMNRQGGFNRPLSPSR